jgi:hypothetical protein
MRVGIERDDYGGVPEHLRDYLGVDALGERQRGAGVVQIVEAEVGDNGAGKEPLEVAYWLFSSNAVGYRVVDR